MKIHFFGHSGILLEDTLTVLIDPWLNNNPLAKSKLKILLKLIILLPLIIILIMLMTYQ